MVGMARPRRTAIALTAGIAGVIGLAVAGWTLLRDDATGHADPPYTWNYFRETPGGLEIFKTVRSCDQVTGARVEDETPRRVVVAIEVAMGGTCGDDAVDRSATVSLDEPLDGRRVYDAVCLSRDGPERACLRDIRAENRAHGSTSDE